jgi:Family of unknown function (DUF6272)
MQNNLNSTGAFAEEHVGDYTFSFKGKITQNEVKLFVAFVEKKLELASEQITVKKRLINLIVESAQNIAHHIPQALEVFDSEFQFSKSQGFYYIQCGNHVFQHDEDIIKGRISKINNLDKEGLDEFYKTSMVENELSEKGTAGLGLIELARKTEEKINHEFRVIDDKVSFFTVKLRIPVS